LYSKSKKPLKNFKNLKKNKKKQKPFSKKPRFFSSSDMDGRMKREMNKINHDRYK